MKKNNPNIEELNTKMHHVSLSSEEKFDMLQNLRAHMNTQPVPSPIFVSPLFKHVFAYSLLGAVLITTGATSFAAEDALPGDILYGIKTSLNENIIQAIALSDTAKARAEINLIDRRMEELSKMAIEDTETPEKIDIVLEKITAHKIDFDEHLVEVAKEEPSERTIEMKAELEAVIETHLEILEMIEDREDIENQKNESLESDRASNTESGDITIELPTPIDSQSQTLEASVTVIDTVSNSELKDATVEVSIDISDLEDTKIEKALNLITNESLGTEVEFEENQPGTKTRIEIRQRIIEKAEKELGIELNF